MSGGLRTIEWPQGARLAVSIVLNVEAWSDHSAGHLWISPLPKDAKVQQDSLTQTDREYGPKVGIWRILDVIEGCGVKATAVVNGLVVERYPEVIKALHDQGHEIGGHGYDQSRPLTVYGTEADA